MVLAAALYTLFNMIKDVDIDRVLGAIAATPVMHIVVAGLFVVCAYLTLTCYEFFALRAIGRQDLSYRLAAFANFTAFSIGHNIGATVFSGGVIRFRIYSAYGLSVVDVTKVAFITGLTFWLGNAFVLGVTSLYDTVAVGAVDQLPPAVNRGLAAALVLGIGIYLAWLSFAPRTFGLSGWKVVLPNVPLTLVQIGIGALDLGCSATVMYMLLPSHPPIAFIHLLVIFVFATLLGFASHTPGGLGVFDATMLFALPQFDKGELLATLLLFRLLFYIAPLCLALVLFAGREIVLGRTGPAP